jgi:hypothetical protein
VEPAALEPAAGAEQEGDIRARRECGELPVEAVLAGFEDDSRNQQGYERRALATISLITPVLASA